MKENVIKIHWVAYEVAHKLGRDRFQNGVNKMSELRDEMISRCLIFSLLIPLQCPLTQKSGRFE